MTRSVRHFSLNRLLAVSAMALALGTVGAPAQDTTSTSVRHGEPSIETKVRNATIVYVEGNNLVLKLEDGKVEHLVVPFDETFKVDGEDVTVLGLTPGTKLTQTITTTMTPRYVNEVRTLKGKVWHVNAPGSVILTLPDGRNHMYQVPSHAQFTINGQKKTVFDLKKGMTFGATIITDSPETVHSITKASVGTAPVLTTPHIADVLLVETPISSLDSMTESVASAEPLPSILPNTASALPFTGLLGLFSIAASFSLMTLHRGLNYLRKN